MYLEDYTIIAVSDICTGRSGSCTGYVSCNQEPYIFRRRCGIIRLQKNCVSFVQESMRRLLIALMGKGAFPGTDDLYTGMLGMHGTKTSTTASVNVTS